jgi:branched-chain amino acid transport system substrate-binding protein
MASRPPVRSGRRRLLAGALAGPLTWLAGPALGAAPARPLRMAFIDPLSGPAGDIGRNSLRSWQFMAERLTASGNPAGVELHIAPFDNKGSPQESLNLLKAAIDHGFRYVLQGNGSGVAAALSEAIVRHNARFPDRSVLFVNYAAMDPALTAEKCSYWHFRVDADTAMKMRALGRFLAGQSGLERIYLLNQNYAHGQQFARFFRAEVGRLAPRVQVVGDELHPPFMGLDFAAQVRNIRASGAQALATGNWGSDLRGLIKALQAADLRIPLFAYYPQLKGTPTVLASSGERLPVYQVASSHPNLPGEMGPLADEFARRYGEDLVVHAAYDGVRMLLKAVALARSIDARSVALQLSGLRFDGFDGPVDLRAQDHQLQKGVYISRWQRTDARHPRAAEGTGFTFVPVQFLPAGELAMPASCDMPRG